MGCGDYKYSLLCSITPSFELNSFIFAVDFFMLESGCFVLISENGINISYNPSILKLPSFAL